MKQPSLRILSTYVNNQIDPASTSENIEMALIYDVNLAVDPEIEQAFSRWLPGHVARVLALPGFIDAVIKAEQRQVGQSPALCVRYLLESPDGYYRAGSLHQLAGSGGLRKMSRASGLHEAQVALHLLQS